MADKHQVAPSYLWGLYGFHLLLSTVYLIYALYNPSDSKEYFRIATSTSNWFDLWGTGTPFMNWLAWPVANFMGFNYAATMYFFSFFGFWGILNFYLAIKEQIGPLPPVMGSLSWIELIWLLPNIHFWSGSLGKGVLALFSVSLFVYGLSRFNTRLVYIFLGALLAYMIRPHLSLVMVGGFLLGVVLSGKSINGWVKLGLVIVSSIAAYYFLQSSLEIATDWQSDNLADFLENRSASLQQAGSGVDISNYNIFMKLFTFWFRPLFVDSGGVLGLITSFENSIYLFFLFIIIRYAAPRFSQWNGWYKSALFIFLFGSLALSQITSNLGIAMRQKAQLMPLFFFIYLKAMEFKARKESVAG